MVQRKYRVLAALAVAVLLVAIVAPRFPRPTASARSEDSLPPLPQARGLVNDFANVIEPACQISIGRIAEEVREKSKGEIVVVTLPSLHGRRIDEWGVRIGRSWGVGFRGAKDDPRTNTGVIVLVVPTEHQMRIELGYGAEAFIADSLVGRILDEQLLPSVRHGAVGLGALRTVNAIAQEFADRFEFDLESTTSECSLRDPAR